MRSTPLVDFFDISRNEDGTYKVTCYLCQATDVSGGEIIALGAKLFHTVQEHRLQNDRERFRESIHETQSRSGGEDSHSDDGRVPRGDEASG